MPELDELRRVVADVLGVVPAAIDDDADLFLLGVDSLRLMRIASRLRTTPERLATEPTLLAWQDRLTGGH